MLLMEVLRNNIVERSCMSVIPHDKIRKETAQYHPHCTQFTKKLRASRVLTQATHVSPNHGRELLMICASETTFLYRRQSRPKTTPVIGKYILWKVVPITDGVHVKRFPTVRARFDSGNRLYWIVSVKGDGAQIKSRHGG